MVEETQNLYERIAGLTNQDLLQMVYLHANQYRSEALTFAKAEIARRGITFSDLDRSQISALSVHPLIGWIQKWPGRIKAFIRRHSFDMGVSLGLTLFLLVNAYNYYQVKWNTLCLDCIISYGFPFNWYAEGGYVGMRIIYWWHGAANILVAIALCLFCGAVMRTLIQKIFQGKSA